MKKLRRLKKKIGSKDKQIMCKYIITMCGITLLTGKYVKDNLFDLSHRVPDKTEIYKKDNFICRFDRLAIVDNNIRSMQPIKFDNGDVFMCNGEIYNYKSLIQKFDIKDYKSNSDCEIIYHVINSLGLVNGLRHIDGVFAFIIVRNDGRIQAGRDVIGVRPLFYTLDNETESYGFASELKALHHIDNTIYAFPNGCVYDTVEHEYPCVYKSIRKEGSILESYFLQSNYEDILSKIRNTLSEAVRKRYIMSDREIGCFLSGGLDSSLISALCCQEAVKANKPLPRLFTIGMTDGSPDVSAAKKVATHLGAKLDVVNISFEEAFNAIPEVIKTLETWDVTTIRASTPQYLLSK